MSIINRVQIFNYFRIFNSETYFDKLAIDIEKQVANDEMLGLIVNTVKLTQKNYTADLLIMKYN